MFLCNTKAFDFLIMCKLNDDDPRYEYDCLCVPLNYEIL